MLHPRREKLGRVEEVGDVVKDGSVTSLTTIQPKSVSIAPKTTKSIKKIKNLFPNDDSIAHELSLEVNSYKAGRDRSTNLKSLHTS